MKRWRRPFSTQQHTQEEEEELPILNTKFLDTQEQEEIVRSFEASHLREAYIWRGVFAVFAASFAAFFLYAAHQQAISPWGTKYHSYFFDQLNSRTIIIADVAEATVFAVTAWALLSQRALSSHLLWLSFVAGLTLMVFWLYHMLRLSTMHWNIMWLPAGPSSCAAICIYVNHLLLETEKELQELRASIYHFKKI